MKRTELFAMAKAEGIGRVDGKGKPIPAPAGAREKLRKRLIQYFRDTPEGRRAWEKRPRITGEGVADYLTIEEIADAILLEVD